MLMDPEAEVSALYLRANQNELLPPNAITLVARLLGPGSVVAVRRLPVLAVYSEERQKILIRSGVDIGALSFALGHELGEWWCTQLSYREPDREYVASRIGAGLLAPRSAVRLAMRETDGSIMALAQWFRVSQTLAALRRGEVVGPLALVTPTWIATRGEDYVWPGERRLRLVANGKAEAPVERVVLTDARRRVALIAA